MFNFPASTKLVIFDFDGTIASLDVDWGGLKSALRLRFPDVSFDSLLEGIDAVRSQNNKDNLRECFDLIAQFEHAHLDALRPRDNVITFIRENSDRFTFAICSSNTVSTLQAALKRLDVASTMHAIVGGDSVTHSKPHPEGILSILKRTGVSASNTVYLGDREIDRETGKNAGVEVMLMEEHYWSS